jgi:hypothetical protein
MRVFTVVFWKKDGKVYKYKNKSKPPCTALYSDTSANEDNLFRNHICYPKSLLAKMWFLIGFYRKSFNSFWMLPTAPKQLMLSGILLLAVSNVNNPVGLVGLPYVMWSAHFFVTHIQTEKISYWNGPTVHVCCFMLALASTKKFVSRVTR